jgi:hypothetical protein
VARIRKRQQSSAKLPHFKAPFGASSFAIGNWQMAMGKWKIQKFAASACEFPFAWIAGFPRLQLF